MLIRLQGALSTSKRRHQHEQRGFRQMKICKQRAYYAKLKAGVDEDIRFVGSCWNAALAQRSRKFQGAYGRGTHSNDAAFFLECAIDLCCRCFRDAEALAVHLVLFNFIDAYGLERPRPTCNVTSSISIPRAR